jgi:hypothetical protein
MLADALLVGHHPFGDSRDFWDRPPVMTSFLILFNEKNSEKDSPENESKNYWYQQKVLVKSFPMNGHVSRFRHP